MPKYLSKPQLKAILKVIKNPRDRAIWLISYWRGLRCSEIGILRRTAFRMDSERPSLGRLLVHRLKHSLGGDYLLNPDETKAIRAWLKIRGDGPGALFTSNRGTGISRRQLDKLMKGYGKAAGLPADLCHFHVLKHSICTHLHQAGVDLLRIQRWVGHKNVNSTVVYTHLVDENRDELGLEIFEKF